MTIGSILAAFLAIANTIEKPRDLLYARSSVAEMKMYNVKRHYDSKHKKDFDSAYPRKGERLKEFKKCFDAYVGEAKKVSVFVQGASHLNEASCRIYHSLAQHQVPFVLKTAFLVGAEVMFAGFPNIVKRVEQINKLPLSSNCCGELRACPAWSIALNERTNISDIAQLLVYFQNFDNGISEDILGLIPLKGTTTAANICNALLQFGRAELDRYEVPSANRKAEPAFLSLH